MKLLPERTVFTGVSRQNERSVGRHQVCTSTRKDQPNVIAYVWYQFTALLRGPALFFLSCSFQHTDNMYAAFYYVKGFFFSVQSPAACQVAWKAEQLHKIPFLHQAAFKQCCSQSVALFPLKSVGAIEQSYHNEFSPYAFEALSRYSPHLKQHLPSNKQAGMDGSKLLLWLFPAALFYTHRLPTHLFNLSYKN